MTRTTVVPDRDGLADSYDITPAFQQYVDGVNSRDYARGHAVLSPEAQRRTPLEEFVRGNRSTRITAFRLDTVYTATEGGVAEAVFTSEQDAVDGPGGQTCSRWSMTYSLARSPGTPSWRIERAQPAPGSPEAC